LSLAQKTARDKQRITEQLYTEMQVEAAGQGDTEAARDILDTFADRVERAAKQTWDCPIPWAYAGYLAGAFRKILADERSAADVALGIKSSKPGRRRGRGSTHD
jgi:hypothetical protein